MKKGKTSKSVHTYIPSQLIVVCCCKPLCILICLNLLFTYALSSVNSFICLLSFTTIVFYTYDDIIMLFTRLILMQFNLSQISVFIHRFCCPSILGCMDLFFFFVFFAMDSPFFYMCIVHNAFLSSFFFLQSEDKKANHTHSATIFVLAK